MYTYIHTYVYINVSMNVVFSTNNSRTTKDNTHYVTDYGSFDAQSWWSRWLLLLHTNVSVYTYVSEETNAYLYFFFFYRDLLAYTLTLNIIITNAHIRVHNHAEISTMENVSNKKRSHKRVVEYLWDYICGL